jgi:beta-glucosidase
MSYTFPKTPPVYPYKDPHLPIEKRITDLLARMTLEEKIKQLDMYWGKEVANIGRHKAESWSEEKTKASLGITGAGSIHDPYPLRPEIANQIQRYAVEKTRPGIPVLFIEEGLHPSGGQPGSDKIIGKI